MLNKMENKVICPRCKQTFICQNSYKCWCVSIKIPDHIKEYISENYTGCICENCIKQLIQL